MKILSFLKKNVKNKGKRSSVEHSLYIFIPTLLPLQYFILIYRVSKRNYADNISQFVNHLNEVRKDMIDCRVAGNNITNRVQ